MVKLPRAAVPAGRVAAGVAATGEDAGTAVGFTGFVVTGAAEGVAAGFLPGGAVGGASPAGLVAEAPGPPPACGPLTKAGEPLGATSSVRVCSSRSGAG